MARLSTSQPFQFLIPPHLLGQALKGLTGLWVYRWTLAMDNKRMANAGTFESPIWETRRSSYSPKPRRSHLKFINCLHHSFFCHGLRAFF